MVELAICLPLLLMLLTGMIQFGIALNKYITLNDAVRAGARQLALGRGLSNPCDPAVAQALKTGSGINLSSSQVTVGFSTTTDYCGSGTYTYTTSGNSSGNENEGDSATVTATQTVPISVFGLGITSLTLSASASDAVE